MGELAEERPHAATLEDCGITPRLLGRVELGEVREAYLHRASRFSPVIERFPLYLVLDGEVGLLGAREFAGMVLAFIFLQRVWYGTWKDGLVPLAFGYGPAWVAHAAVERNR